MNPQHNNALHLYTDIYSLNIHVHVTNCNHRHTVEGHNVINVYTQEHNTIV